MSKINSGNEGEILARWVENLLFLDVINHRGKIKSSCYLVRIGCLPPFKGCLQSPGYNYMTRELTCCIPAIYRHEVDPNEAERAAMQTYHVYYAFRFVDRKELTLI